MLTQITAAAIHNCHQQIANAKTLLTETRKEVEREGDSKLIDNFGRQARSLQLGVPSGQSGHRILNVDFDLAAIIIEAQILKYEQQLVALNEIAKMECASDAIAADQTI